MSKPVFYGRVTFEYETLSLALCLGWKIRLSLDHTPYKITYWSMIPIVELVFPRQLSCRQYVQREVQPGKPFIASTISTVLNPSIVSAISAVLKSSIASTIPESFLNHMLL